MDADGTVRIEASNRVGAGNATQHPEFELARSAATHMTPDERTTATVFTSGEHCAMCSAAEFADEIRALRRRSHGVDGS